LFPGKNHMRLAFALLATVIVAATPAHAEVTAQSDNGFAVKHAVTVSVDPDAAFAMLRTPAKWWDKDHTWTGRADNLYMDAQAGGCFCELIPNEATTESGAPQRTLRGSVQHMQMVYVDPGKLLRLSGALGPLQGEAVTGTLTISLVPIKGGTRLTFEYVVGGFMRMPIGDIAPGVDSVIGAQASRLAMALGPLVGGGGAGKEPMPKDKQADAPEPDTSGVAALVTDLEPDDTSDDSVTDGVTEDSVIAAEKAVRDEAEEDVAAEPRKAADIAAPKRYKPGTRPLTRPPRNTDEEESGR
jgi:hypothetical protein